jgi:hypothetical protein
MACDATRRAKKPCPGNSRSDHRRGRSDPIQLSRAKIAAALQVGKRGQWPDLDPVVLLIEAKVRRAGKGKRLVIGNGAETEVNAGLVELIKEAFAIRNQFLSGSHDSIEAMSGRLSRVTGRNSAVSSASPPKPPSKSSRNAPHPLCKRLGIENPRWRAFPARLPSTEPTRPCRPSRPQPRNGGLAALPDRRRQDRGLFDPWAVRSKDHIASK